MLKVGIYSGTFDPVHDGHIAFAREAVEKFGLSKVYFLVEPRPRRKQGVKALEHRVNMVQTAVKNNSKLGTIIIHQARFTPRETMPLLLSRFKGAEINMLIGDDTLNHIADWPHVDELVNSVKFIVGARRQSPDNIKVFVDKLNQTKGVKINFKVFVPTGAKYSSSQIKRQLRNNKDTTAVEGLDEEVLDYIKANKLYFSASE